MAVSAPRRSPTLIRNGRIIAASRIVGDVLQGMWGLGDNLYTLAWLAAADPDAVCRLTVAAPWHELYRLLPRPPALLPPRGAVRGTLYDKACERATSCDAHSRLQIELAPFLGGSTRRVHYLPEHLERPGGSIAATIRACVARVVGVPSAARRLAIPPASSPHRPPYVAVKQAGTRNASRRDSRACDPRYLHRAVAVLHARGIRTENAVAEGVEHLVGEPLATAFTHRSQDWDAVRYLQWLQGAQAVIGTVGSFVPSAMHAGRPALIVMGGYQGHNAPSQLACPGIGSNLAYLQVDTPCPCADLTHDCDRAITGFDRKFVQWCASAGI